VFRGAQEQLRVEVGYFVVVIIGGVDVETLVEAIVERVLNECAAWLVGASRHIDGERGVGIFDVAAAVDDLVLVAGFNLPLALLVKGIYLVDLQISVVKHVCAAVLAGTETV
jgi:hypothetical protein